MKKRLLKSNKDKPVKKIFSAPKVKVIGIGGAGGNALTRMARFKIPGVEFVAINTDVQDLKKTRAGFKLRIGRQITKGLGTGMNPEIGSKAAQEQSQEIQELVKGSDLVFLTAGFGGGTGTGALPVVAEICKDLGILTVAVVTKPFSFEGMSRKNVALQGIRNLENKVDSLLVVSNDKLVSLVEKNTPLMKAFFLADEILHKIIISVTDLILRQSLVTISFADIKAILKNAGLAFFGQGTGSGQNRSQEAAVRAINSSLLETCLGRAPRVLFNVSARNLKLVEIDAVANIVSKNVLPKAKVVFGAREDERLKIGEMKVTLIATGLGF